MYDKPTNPMALRDFRARLHGELILSDDDGYDSARRVWNGMIDKYPALIYNALRDCASIHLTHMLMLLFKPVTAIPLFHTFDLSHCTRASDSGKILQEQVKMTRLRRENGEP